MKSPKIMLIDIETCPNIVLSWGIGHKVSLSYDNIIQERKIICICWKWLDNSEVYSLDWGVNKQCDKAMLKKISKEIAKADLVIGHNGDRYDIKFINGRLLYHGLPPLGSLSTEDTLTMSRRTFYLNSHRLDYLGDYLKEGRKLETGGYSLWKEVLLNKCPESLDNMIKYCKEDVRLLGRVYKRISPYVQHKVNKALITGTDKYVSCKSCGSDNKQKYGIYYTSSGRYQKYKCNDCGHVYRDTRMHK